MDQNMRSGSKIVKGLLECPESYGEPQKTTAVWDGMAFLVLHESVSNGVKQS